MKSIKIEPAVKKEVTYIGIFCIILSCLTEAVFLVCGFWDYTVLLGNLFGVFISFMNFFIMCLSIQKAMDYENKEAVQYMKASRAVRMFVLAVAVAVGVLAPCFNMISVIVSLFFPRIAYLFKIEKKDDDTNNNGSNENKE